MCRIGPTRGARFGWNLKRLSLTGFRLQFDGPAWRWSATSPVGSSPGIC